MAVRELITNAWDADASRVEVFTNQPMFLTLSVRDNGMAMKAEEFGKVMDGGIGNSAKPETGRTLGDRPLIGRLGLGILALAQLCYELEVESHHKESKTAFLGTMVFDKSPMAPVETTAGTYQYDSIDYDERLSGTRVTATLVRDGYLHYVKRPAISSMNEPRDFLDVLSAARQVGSIHDLGGYWNLVWELALASPLGYSALMDADKALARLLPRPEHGKTTFELYVDGMQIFRPVIVPSSKTNESAPVVTRDLTSDVEVGGSQLKFTGYLAAQDGLSISPAELRGLIIRMNGASIGKYDRTFLGYKVVQGPRLGWITGEIDIQVGLVRAMNIDRASFNESDEQFIYLRTKVLDALESIIKADLYPGMRLRTKRRAETTDTRLWEQLAAQGVINDSEISAPLVRRHGESVVIGSCQLPWTPSKRRLATIALAAFARVRGADLDAKEARDFLHYFLDAL